MSGDLKNDSLLPSVTSLSGPLRYLDKMGGIKWPAVPLG